MSEPPIDRDARGEAPAPPAGCGDVQRLLLEAPRPGDPLEAAAQAHLAECERCRALRSQLVLVDDATREAAPELPDGFALSLRRRLREHRAAEAQPAAVPERRRSRTPIVLAAAAVVLVAAGVATLTARWSGDKATYQRLHLAVQATQDCDEVLFDVELPDGVKPMPGLPEAIGRDRTLQWRSQLRAGANDFDLPLVAQRRTGEVQVRLRLGEKTWTGTVSLAAAQGRADAGPAEVRLALLVGPGAPRGGGRP